MELKGCGTALATPFRNGKVDFEAYRTLVKRQVESGIHFLVPLGSTAETPCLENDEKCELLRITRELCPDRPIVAGVGTNSPAATIRNIRMLEPYEPDAWLVVVPYYNKPTQQGIYEYFSAIAASTDKGIVAYNVPGRTGTNMTAETTIRVAGIPGVIAVKEALVESLQAGDIEKARLVDEKLAPLYEACFVESNPIPAKAGLSALGLCTPEMRLPLTEAVSSTFDAMNRVIVDLGI